MHVAPHVGAWIEILVPIVFVGGVVVAPHVGAWIEILNDNALELKKIESHLT